MEKQRDILKYSTWVEFQKESGQFEGKIPRIFTDVSDDMKFSTKEIAEMLGCSSETVRNWCRSGKLRVISPVGQYRVLGSDLKEFVYQWYRADLLKSSQN